MQEITRVSLENEMDLILAHRRAMKLAELTGLSLSAQTTFATAVSEVSRSAIESGKKSFLSLSVQSTPREKNIVAVLKNEMPDSMSGGLEYAKKLVNKYQVSVKGPDTIIELFYTIPYSVRTEVDVLDNWRSIFRNEHSVSPYEELKHKNEQLQDLSDKLQKSETQYRTLTNSLPLIIFSLSTEGEVLYANEWLNSYSGETIESLNQHKWKNIVHPDDYDAFSLILKNDITRSGGVSIKAQVRLKQYGTNEYLAHQLSLHPITGEQKETLYWNGLISDIHVQKVYEETLQDNIALKEAQEQLKLNQVTMEQYIHELNRSNEELQQFAFIASHDLQEPLRKILFYSDYLLNKGDTGSNAKSTEMLQKVHESSYRMRDLIRNILFFAQINKDELLLKEVDLNQVVQEVLQDMEVAITEKQAEISVGTLPVITGDERMMQQLFENLISNSLKYTRTGVRPQISIQAAAGDRYHEITVTDNGIGFDEKYLPHLFTLFKRLHGRSEYEGTGIGLAICRKIVDIHQGKITAEGKEGEGAVFFVSLPVKAATV